MEKFEMIDYSDNRTEVELDLDKVARIDIRIVTGDEIWRVINKDYTMEEYDSFPLGRLHDYDDGEYTVYFPDEGIDLIHDEKWVNKKSSYDRQYYSFGGDSSFTWEDET